MIDMIETTQKVTAFVVAPEAAVELPYAVAWQDRKGRLCSGRVIGKRWMPELGDCYVVGGMSHKPTYSWAWIEDVPIVDTLPCGGAWVYPQDVDAMLGARWDDRSEREALRDRLQKFEWDLNGVGGWQYD